MATYTDGFYMLIRCPMPECAGRDPQTAQFSRAALKQKLDDNKDIRVFGMICGHHWSFTKKEKDELREDIEAGKLG
jgi:hypothetical protein